MEGSSPAPLPPPVGPAAEPAPLRPWPWPLRTGFGGVFFLINLGLYLDLYGDFSTPLTPGIELPLWDFLALVGRDLAGAELEEDPAWGLLAALAGRREGEPPGHRFAPSDFVPPASWSAPLRGGLRVAVPPPAPAEGASPLDRWLGMVLPYARARLALALPGEDPGRRLCAIPAQVHVTASHLDVVMALGELPIEVRLAGLDRDPGWVPAAGRWVAFHFLAGTAG